MFPKPTFLPQDDDGAMCETFLHGRLIRADSPELLAEAVLERLLGPLPTPGHPA